MVRVRVRLGYTMVIYLVLQHQVSPMFLETFPECFCDVTPHCLHFIKLLEHLLQVLKVCVYIITMRTELWRVEQLKTS